MSYAHRIVIGLGVTLLLALGTGCGTTKHFVEQPHLTVSEPGQTARQAIETLFSGLTPPYTVSLCEAEPSSGSCTPIGQGISAKGVGGLFLPLSLRVTGMEVRKQRWAANELAFDASLHASVDSLAPMCGTVGGKIISRDNNTASVQLKNFYCNWAVIGNVLVNADLSIDSIDVKDRVVTGFYKLTFHGTGNARGSGYYRAVIANGP